MDANRPVEIVQYTAICGKYDQDRDDITVFRDSKASKFLEPVMNAKIFKVLPHMFVDAPIRIWMDGNVFPKMDPRTLVDDLLKDNDIAVFRHPWRTCIYQEHEPARLRLSPDHQPLIDAQVARYRQDGMPKNWGLAECGVILSRASDRTREFFERWWTEISRYSSRDQMSFPYVWWRMRDRIRIRLVDAELRFRPWFRYMERIK